MCGLVGLANPYNVPLEELGVRSGSICDLGKGMLSLIEHRGPDEMGLAFFGNSFMGSARLSIIDLDNGTQPFSNEDESVWISYNGEIYDVDKHLIFLKSQGISMKSACDTEIVLRYYELFGEKISSFLNGEYSFCILDRKKKLFLLYRDYWGTKPLYYTSLGKGAYLYSSEIKPILYAKNQSNPQLSKIGVQSTLEGWVCVPPYTSFEGIFQFKPGAYNIISQKKEGVQVYPFLLPKREVENFCLTDEIEKSVKRRLVADVPVGAYLSGGLDSSIIAYHAAKKCSHQLETFSIEFTDKQFDESNEQKKLSKFLETKHHSLKIDNLFLRENLVKAIIAGESLVFRSAFIPMMGLSKLVKDSGVKVVLTGEGADELLGGYDIYRELHLLYHWREDSSSDYSESRLRDLYHYLPLFSENNIRLLKPFYKSFLSKRGDPYWGHAIRWSAINGNKNFLADYDVNLSMTNILDFEYSWEKKSNPFDECRLTEIRTLLHGYLLSTQGDRMASHNSVEIRLPYLDVNLASAVLSQPLESYIKNFKEKELLFNSYREKLPEYIINKRKTPYLAPDIGLLYEGDQFWRDYFCKESIEKCGCFNYERVEGLLKRIDQKNDKKKISRKDNTALFSILSAAILKEEIGKHLCPQNVNSIIVRDKRFDKI